MRRADKEITAVADKLAVLDKCQVCRLALVDQPYPYIVPLNFGYTMENDQLTLYFHSALEGKKLDLLKQNPHACFEVDCNHGLIAADTACGHGYAFQSVVGFGTITLVEDDASKIAGLTALMRQQTGMDKTYQFPPEQLAAVAVLKMTVDSFTGKQKLVSK